MVQTPRRSQTNWRVNVWRVHDGNIIPRRRDPEAAAEVPDKYICFAFWCIIRGIRSSELSIKPPEWANMFYMMRENHITTPINMYKFGAHMLRFILTLNRAYSLYMWIYVVIQMVHFAMVGWIWSTGTFLLLICINFFLNII